MFFVLLFDDLKRRWMITNPVWYDKESAEKKARQVAGFHYIKLNKDVKVVELIPFPYIRRVSDFRFRTIRVEK